MTSKHSRQSAARPHYVGMAQLLLISLTTLASSISCDNALCEEKREELYVQKIEWQKCSKSSDCIIVGGNNRDCSGVMSCNFAVNRNNRVAAERRVASLPQETIDCHLCSAPSCPTGNYVACELETKLCVVVEEDFPGATENAVNVPAGDFVPPEDPPATGGAANDPGTGGLGDSGMTDADPFSPGF